MKTKVENMTAKTTFDLIQTNGYGSTTTQSFATRKEAQAAYDKVTIEPNAIKARRAGFDVYVEKQIKERRLK